MNPIWIGLQLYLPGILFFASLLIASKMNLQSTSTFTAQPLGVFGISFPIKNNSIARTLMILCALGFLSIYLFYDYSDLFPKYLTMDVYYDQNRLADILRHTFNPAELQELQVRPANQQAIHTYFDSLDGQAKSVLGGAGFFAARDGSVHSTGKTTFKVRKISGWQRYEIVESRGELTHTLNAPHVPETQFYTFFDKLPTSADYIEPSFSELFVTRQVILHPRFRQSLAELRTSKSVSFNISVVGVTKVYIFPWPHFSPTVYCGDVPGYGLLPVAYAIYDRD